MKRQLQRHLIILLTLSFMFLCKAANAGDVYWNPLAGDDGYLGTSAISPVRTFERAKYLVSQQPEGSYIVLVRYYFLHDGEVVTLDGKISETRNVLLKQHGEAVSGHSPYNTNGVDGYNFILRHSGTKLTLKNITIEGTYTGTGINPYTGPAYPADNCPLILLEENTQLEMGEGAILKNCRRTEFSDPDAHGYGAAVYMWAGASFTMNGGVIEDCITDYGGGAIYMRENTTFTMNGGTIQNCGTGQYGGAIYARLGSATINLNGGVIKKCYATNGTTGGHGGAIAFHAPTGSGIDPVGNYSLTMNGGEIDSCYSYGYSGGIYVEGRTGTNTITLTKGSIHHCVCRPTADNLSSGWGGAIHVNYGTVNVNGAQMLIHHNYARKYGAAINAGGNVSIVFSAGKIYNNTTGIDADDQGVVTAAAAFHAYSGASISMSGGEMYGNHTSGVGGAMHASGGGGITISGGKIYNNSAKDQGGAINVNVDTPVSFVAGAGGNSCEVYGNRAVCAGVVAIDGSTLTIAAGSFHDNVADQTIYPSHTQKGRGGAFYVKTSDNTHIGHLIISGGEIYNNVASIDGGAVYLEKKPDSSTSEDIPSVTISGGSIHDNTAISGNGGGIYYDTGAKMYVDNGSMTVKDNTAQGSPNNVYIRTGNVIDIKSDATFTPVYVGFYTENRTPNIPVFRGTNTQVTNIYDGMTTVPMTTNVVDDSQDFSPLRPGSPGTEYDYILYFGDASPWSPLQQTVNTLPTKVNNVYQIGTVKELTAFLWLVNNIDTHHNFNTDLSEAEMTHPEASAKLTADIDMEGQYWVPIANYTGTFDGNGYIISHLTMVPSNVESERGLFGVNTSGTIKNVNLRDGYFGGDGDYIGTIVYQMDGGSLYNSVAQCQMLATAATTTAGGLVGHINGGTVHSSIATCDMTGYTMGGLAGKISSSGNLFNSFANPQFAYIGATNAYFVGGLVADNAGTVANCYVRFSRTQALTGAKFGQLAGNNDNTINPCYTPFTSDVPSIIVHTGSATSSTYKVVDAPYLYNRPNDNLVGSTPLYKKLNDWVSSKIKTIADLAYWKRSTAGGYSYTYNDGVANITVTGGNINDDYPMPKMKGLSNVSSVDGFYFDYAPSLSRAITKYNGLTGGGTVWLYASPKNAAGADEEVNVDNDSDVLLYIDEDATLLQAANNSLTAYTSQTLKVETESRWHFISSSLGNSDIGFNYGTTSQVNFSWSENPCDVSFNGNNDDALFPIDMPNINKVDLYCFYEPEYHWLNLKRNTNSHWHMNATTTPIAYNGNGTGGNGNETYLVPGKGYLASIDKDQLLQNKGTLNNGAGTVTVQDITYNEANAWAGLLGYNLLGNPYQSYLDFNAFIGDDANSGLNASKGNAEPTYAVYDPEIGSYIQYKSGSSKGSRSADGMIHPHQGFMIRRTGGSYSATATFKNTMRSTNSTSPFRGEQAAFPLVNLTVTDDEGNADVAVLELGRDADRGAEKLRANTCKGWLYLHHDNDDYGILFRSEVEDYQPLWFEASEAGTYTMRWETANGNFESLTLVDNIAGVVTDMLATDSYVFEANPDQYKSRFKIVIGDYKDIEENEGGASTGSASDETFAYYANGEIHLVETQNFASLQIVDMTGRVILSRDGVHTVSTNGIVPGVYVLRLTTDKGTKIQKMVIE